MSFYTKALKGIKSTYSGAARGVSNIPRNAAPISAMALGGAGVGAVTGGIHGGLSDEGSVLGGAAKGAVIGGGVGGMTGMGIAAAVGMRAGRAHRGGPSGGGPDLIGNYADSPRLSKMDPWGSPLDFTRG